MLFCRMKMSLSQHPSLSNHCAPLKEKVAGEEENEKKKKKPSMQIFYKHFNKREFNLLLAFRIQRTNLYRNVPSLGKSITLRAGWFGNLLSNLGCFGGEPRGLSLGVRLKLAGAENLKRKIYNLIGPSHKPKNLLLVQTYVPD